MTYAFRTFFSSFMKRDEMFESTARARFSDAFLQSFEELNDPESLLSVNSPLDVGSTRGCMACAGGSGRGTSRGAEIGEILAKREPCVRWANYTLAICIILALAYLVVPTCLPWLYGGAARAGAPKAPIDLTDSSVDLPSASDSDAFCLYYSQNCKHCHGMMQYFQKASRESKAKFYRCEHRGISAQTARQLGITGYPSVYYFQKGVRKENFIGNEGEAKFYEWVRRVAAR